MPWFTGDLAYHRAVMWSVVRGDLVGAGPYDGMPAYYGGTFTLLWAIPTALGLDPDVALSRLSWLEPLGWVLSSWFLGRSIWPHSRARQFLFSTFLLLAAGSLSGQRELWVNAPNVAGRAFWPLFPRDLALMALLVAVGLAVSGRRVLAAVAAGLAVTTQLQVGLVSRPDVLAAPMSALTPDQLCPNDSWTTPSHGD